MIERKRSVLVNMAIVSEMILLVIVYVLVIKDVMSECKTTEKLLKEKYHGITDEFVIWSGFVGLRIECFHKCYHDSRCVTFQYNENGTCLTFAGDVDALQEWETGLGTGHVMYQLQGRGSFGEDCMSDDECHFPNSECRQSTCGCIIGYSFNPVKGACTHGCTTYSNSYAIFPDTQVRTGDIAMDHVHVQSLKECQIACSKKSNCKTFEFSQEGKCFQKSGGVLDGLSMYNMTGRYHGVRNCYN